MEDGAGPRPDGGPTWLTGTYDAALDTLYWGVGNPNPDFDPSAFSGEDLLYTDSLLALDPRTGTIKWHYKWTPRNIYDYDGVDEAVLVDLPIGGKTIKALVHADRNGYMFERVAVAAIAHNLLRTLAGASAPLTGDTNGVEHGSHEA